MSDQEKIDMAMGLIRAELEKATDKFGPFNSTHEGYAVILEELDELWDEVKTNNSNRATHEAIQVGAMAARFIVDVGFRNLYHLDQGEGK